MIEQLLGSKTRVKLLQLFLSSPEQAFYVREITRKIDEQINSVRRELSNLLSIGIITSDTNNNRLYYQADQSYKYFEPLSMMFGENSVATRPVKTEVEDKEAEIEVSNHPLTKPIQKLGHVELALLSGRFTRDTRSGVDLLLVGNLNETQLSKFISNLEQQESSEIKYACLSKKDWEYRLKINDRFAATLLSSRVIVLIDQDKQILQSTNRKVKK